MKVGTIFLWPNFQYLDHENQSKDIYGIFLGKNGEYSGETPMIIFQKLTGKSHYYEPGGKRHSNRHFVFEQKSYSKLKKDSIFDFSFKELIFPETLFLSAAITELHIIPDQTLRTIYNHIKSNECGFSMKSKLQIHECMNLEGHTGLERPKKKQFKRNY